MALPPPESRRLTFDVFTADPSLGRLLKGGIPVKLAPQPFKVLLLLIERRGGIVSREEIREHLWGNSTFVDFERGINFSINQIRTVLCDDVERPRYIETLPKIGYRFIAEVTEQNGHSDGAAVSSIPPADTIGRLAVFAATKRNKWRVAAGVVMAFVIPAIITAWQVGWRRERSATSNAPAIHSLAVLPLENLSGDPAQDYFCRWCN